MALSVNWATGMITVPQSDCTLVSGTQYTITVDYLFELLRDRSDAEDATPFPVLFHNTPPTATTPRIVEVNDQYYTMEFEDGLWSVDIINGNTNYRAVEVKNYVSVGTNNTVGFITVSVGSGLSTAEHDKLMALPTATENATATLDAAAVTPIAADVEEVRGQPLDGVGSAMTPWGPA